MTDIASMPPGAILGNIKREKSKRLFSGSRVEMAREALKGQPNFVDLDPWQVEFLSCDKPRIIVNCSRQIGKSTCASIYALHRAMFVPKSLVLIFAPALRQSMELFMKLKPIYRDLGELVEATSDQKLTLELVNGSRIVALPGTEKTTRGFAAPSLVIIDEASQIDDQLYSTGIKPMLLRSQGQIMLLSTPYGRRGVFYKTWMEGQGWHRFMVPATEVASLSNAFLEEERREKTAAEFAQEYLCQFVDLEDQLIPTELIEASVDRNIEPLFLGSIR